MLAKNRFAPMNRRPRLPIASSSRQRGVRIAAWPCVERVERQGGPSNCAARGPRPRLASGKRKSRPATGLARGPKTLKKAHRRLRLLGDNVVCDRGSRGHANACAAFVPSRMPVVAKAVRPAPPRGHYVALGGSSGTEGDWPCVAGYAGSQHHVQ